MTREKLLEMQESLREILSLAYRGEHQMAGLCYYPIRSRASKLLTVIEQELENAAKDPV